MVNSLATSDVMSRLRPGDHVCQLFDNAQDIAEVLVPYFKQGLEANESCVWITSAPFPPDRAESEMRAAVSDFDLRAANGQIRIMGHEQWYTKAGGLSPAETIQGWLVLKDDALAQGYHNLRISGNVSFVDESMSAEFLAYERSINELFKDQPIVTLCSYPLNGSIPGLALGAVKSHGLCLCKHMDHWHCFLSQGETGRSDQPDPAASNSRTAALSPWINLSDVIARRLSLEFAQRPGRIVLEGSPVMLTSRQATYLSIILEELVNNAGKYGALSAPEGKLIARWHISFNGYRRLHFSWIETGLSDLRLPDMLGRGTRMLALMVKSYLRQFEPTGMTCSFEIDLEAPDADFLVQGRGIDRRSNAPNDVDASEHAALWRQYDDPRVATQLTCAWSSDIAQLRVTL